MQRKTIKRKLLSVLLLVALLLPLMPQGKPLEVYADVWLSTSDFTETVNKRIAGENGAVHPITDEGGDGGKFGETGGSTENKGWARTFQMTDKFVPVGTRTWITPKHAVYSDVYINGVIVGQVGYHFQPKDLVNYSNGGCKISITGEQFWNGVTNPQNNASGREELMQKTGLSLEELKPYVLESYLKGCGLMFNAWAVSIWSKGPGGVAPGTGGMYHNPQQIQYTPSDGVQRSVWAIKPGAMGTARVYDRAGARAFANGTMTNPNTTSFIYVDKFVNDFGHYAHVISNTGLCESCDAYVHKYYYVKQGETETLENYIWQPYKKEQGYTVKNEGAYKVVAYHTITDETACKPEPNLPNYETTVPLFNGGAKGTGPGVLPKEKTLQPAPKGSEIAIKLLREEEVPQEPPKDTVLELTQKRISRRFDLTPWKKDGEDKPLTLTYTWPSVPPCVCEQCDADSPCVNFCFSTVEPSMTFLIKQINTLNRHLIADGEYFKAYEEDNTAQVA